MGRTPKYSMPAFELHLKLRNKNYTYIRGCIRAVSLIIQSVKDLHDPFDLLCFIETNKKNDRLKMKQAWNLYAEYWNQTEVDQLPTLTQRLTSANANHIAQWWKDAFLWFVTTHELTYKDIINLKLKDLTFYTHGIISVELPNTQRRIIVDTPNEYLHAMFQHAIESAIRSEDTEASLFVSYTKARLTTENLRDVLAGVELPMLGSVSTKDTEAALRMAFAQTEAQPVELADAKPLHLWLNGQISHSQMLHLQEKLKAPVEAHDPQTLLESSTDHDESL